MKLMPVNVGAVLQCRACGLSLLMLFWWKSWCAFYYSMDDVSNGPLHNFVAMINDLENIQRIDRAIG